jgi:hypothetical protein
MAGFPDFIVYLSIFWSTIKPCPFKGKLQRHRLRASHSGLIRIGVLEKCSFAKSGQRSPRRQAMALRSQLFRGDQRLEAAAVSDPAHVTPGSTGEHVGKIQTALRLLDDATIAGSETDNLRYGPTTTAAVLAYKQARNIINTAYQTTADNIVGKMTIAALDEEMLAHEADDTGIDPQIASAILGVISELDSLLLQRKTAVSPELRFALERLRLQALLIPGVFQTSQGEVAQAYFRGIRHMEANAPPQPQIVFAAAVVVVAGVALTAAEIALILAILALAAILLLCAISPEFRARAEVLKSEVIDLGSKAIVESVASIAVIDAAVDRCRAQANLTNPKCVDALRRFDAKKADIRSSRDALQAIIRKLTSKVTSIFKKADAEEAVRLTKELASLMKELKDIVAEIMNECGCRFLAGI